jgi:hypothetical protein
MGGRQGIRRTDSIDQRLLTEPIRHGLHHLVRESVGLAATRPGLSLSRATRPGRPDPG